MADKTGDGILKSLFDGSDSKDLLRRLRAGAWTVSAVWLVLLSLALIWHWNQMEQRVLDLAIVTARSAHQKDMVVRDWALTHGGVYVPVTSRTRPVQYLEKIPERDVATPSGRVLTLLNPSSIARQMQELGRERYGLRSHLTSFKPMQPENVPDPWEAKSLEALQRGEEEVYSVEELDGEKYLRYMRPQVTEGRCLQCHSDQGYEEGNIQGGCSISVPMKPYDDLLRAQHISVTLGYMVMGGLGLVGFWWGVGRMGRSLVERNFAVARLAQSEKRFRLLYDRAPVAYQSLDTEGIILDVNEAYLALIGYQREEVIGRPFFSFVNPEHVPMVRDCFRGFVACGSVRGAEFDLVRKDGSVLSVSGDGNIVWDGTGQIRQVHSVLQDVTERRRVLRALQESETLFRSVLENVSLAAVMLDARGRVTFCNDTFLDLTGWKRHEVLHGDWFDLFIPPNVRSQGREMYERSMAAGNFQSYFRLVVLTRSGDRRLFAWSNILLRDAQGNAAGITCIAEDITERRRVENALREAEALYRSVVDTSPDGIVVVDSEGRIVFASAQALESFGLKSPEEALGRSGFDFFKEGGRESAMARFASMLESGERTRYDYDLFRGDGTSFVGEINASPIRDTAGIAKGVVAVIRDVTDRRQLEDRLRHARKMEAVGQLAAGVAHDLNNLLSPVLGYAELILDGVEEEARIARHAEQIQRAGLRARDLVRQLLAFGRRQTLQVRTLDLNRVLEGLEKLLRRTLRANIRMVMETAPSLPPIRADVGQIEQVIMNLAVNAQDAMPEGGALLFRTQVVSGEAGAVKNGTIVDAGRQVALVVADGGCGMDSDTRERIFEPFFTTKSYGKGTGLGLSTVYGIVTQHGGNIQVLSEPGMGTTFIITFPVTEALPEEAAPPSSGGRFRGAERVLVVEDNDMVRNLAVEILAHQGYRVLSAANGEEVLRLLDRGIEPVDLLLTDVVMPDMNGKEVYSVVCERFPDVRVIYMTGYADDVIAHHGVLKEGIAFIQKPFSLEGLSAKVREALEKPGGRVS